MARLTHSEYRTFFFKGRFHFLDKTRTDQMALCGLSPLGGPGRTNIIDMDTAAFPPDICSQCLIQAGLATAYEEPIEEARARGYRPSSAL